MEQFVETILNIASEADAPKVALRSIEADGPFKANFYELKKAPSERSLKLPDAARGGAADAAERRAHPLVENEAGGQEQ